MRARSTVGSSNLPLQFTPKYRRDVLESEKVRTVCRKSVRGGRREVGIVIHACEFGPDHGHLFIGNCMKYSVPELAQRFKGYRSTEIREECRDEIVDKLWDRSFWSTGYFHEYIGRFANDSMSYYIERQQGKHWLDVDFDVFSARSASRQIELADLL